MDNILQNINTEALLVLQSKNKSASVLKNIDLENFGEFS